MNLVVSRTLRASPDRCFSAFCDVRRLHEWVPGLRRAKVVRSDEGGRPLEVLFEFGDKLSYSLLYEYDVATRRVEWRAGVGRRDAVEGWAQFAELPDGAAGCELRYVNGAVGVSEERHADAGTLADALARWIGEQNFSGT